ncbi:alpha-L-rhamnosidase [Klebsiella pneumoniae]|nr:alpha-L-rhamnosidase [Klebsiella pneumoniae]
MFISGAVRQVSWASQIWLVLAEVGTAGQRQALMRRLQQQPPAIAMNTPYLRHHHIVALLQSGLREEAVAEIKAYFSYKIESLVSIRNALLFKGPGYERGQTLPFSLRRITFQTTFNKFIINGLP